MQNNNLYAPGSVVRGSVFVIAEEFFCPPEAGFEPGEVSIGGGRANHCSTPSDPPTYQALALFIVFAEHSL